MKVIEASYEILPKHVMLVDQIEIAGRVAYKSEDKIKDGSAKKFVRGMINSNHWPVLDLGSVTMEFDMGASSYASFMAVQNWGDNKYIFFDVIAENVHRPGDKRCLMTGSPRALTDYFNKYSEYNLMNFIAVNLIEYDPVCFSGIKIKHGGQFNILGIRFVDVDQLLDEQMITNEVYKRHKHLGVRFIHNRVFTHEIVRHRPCGFLQESQRYCAYAQERFGKEVTFIKPSIFDFDDMDLSVWEAAMQTCEEHYLHLLENNSAQAARTVLPNSCKTEIIVFANLIQWEHMFRLRTSKGAEPSMRQVMIPLCEEVLENWPMIDVETPAYE